jgi:hypothetical protein
MLAQKRNSVISGACFRECGLRKKSGRSLTEWNREYYDQNKDSRKDTVREYHHRNKENISESGRAYYSRNKDNSQDVHRGYRHRNKETLRDRKLAYYLQHRTSSHVYSPRKSRASWRTQESVRAYFDSIKGQLLIVNYTDWYRISRSQITKLGGVFDYVDVLLIRRSGFAF